MNLKKLMKRRIKDEWSVAPSSFIVKRLVKGLEESHNIIKQYFPKNGTESEYVEDLENMVNYFNGYK